MHNPIIMISVRVENILKPIAKWVFSIGILGSIDMQAEINANQ